MKYFYNKEKKIAYLYLGLVKILEIFFKIYSQKEKKFPDKIEKILIIKPDHIGDTIISTICLKPLKENYSDSKIDVLCGSWGKKTYEYQNKINKIYILDHMFLNRSNMNIMKKGIIFIKQYLKNLFLLKKENYDLCILLRAPLKGNLISLAGFINSKYVIGYEGMGCENVLDNKVSYSQYIPERENFFNLLKVIPNFTFKENKYKYEIILPQNIDIANKIKTLKISKEKINICINTAGHEKNRRLSKYNILKIIENILKINKKNEIYLIKSPDNQKILEELKKEMKTNKIKKIFEVNNIFELGFVLEKMDLLITVDTAITHLGSIYLDNIMVIYEKNKSKYPRFSPNCKKEYFLISKDDNLNNINFLELILKLEKWSYK